MFYIALGYSQFFKTLVLLSHFSYLEVSTEAVKMVTIAGVQLISESWVIESINCPLLSSLRSAGMASWLDGWLRLPHANICTIPKCLDSITCTDAPLKIKMLLTYMLTEKLHSSLFVLCRANINRYGPLYFVPEPIS